MTLADLMSAISATIKKDAQKCMVVTGLLVEAEILAIQGWALQGIHSTISGAEQCLEKGSSSKLQLLLLP